MKFMTQIVEDTPLPTTVRHWLHYSIVPRLKHLLRFGRKDVMIYHPGIKCGQCETESIWVMPSKIDNYKGWMHCTSCNAHLYFDHVYRGPARPGLPDGVKFLW